MMYFNISLFKELKEAFRDRRAMLSYIGAMMIPSLHRLFFLVTGVVR